MNEKLDMLLKYLFQKEYEERRSFVERHEKITKKKNEYLNSERYMTLKDILNTFLKNKKLTTVYQCVCSLNEEFKQNYTYNEIIYIIMDNKCKYIIHGPYIYNKVLNSDLDTLTDDQISIIGYMLLAQQDENIHNRMFEFMKTKDNFYKSQKIDLYTKWYKKNVLYQIGEEFLEVKLKPFENKEYKKCHSVRSSSEDDSDNSRIVSPSRSFDNRSDT